MVEIQNEPLRTKYESLLKSCYFQFSEDDVAQIEKAFQIVCEHNKDNEKEIDNRIEVAMILTTEIGLGRISVVCGLLHKLVIDNVIQPEDLQDDFSDQIIVIFRGLKEIHHIYSSYKIIDSENYRKLLLSFAEDIRVQLIFLAEKMHELRNAKDMPEDERKRLSEETNAICIPFAHRLGLYNLKSEMEDLALKYSQPKIYNEIYKKLTNTKAAREKFINEFIEPIKAEMDKRGFKYKVKSRTKTIASILNKMRKKQVEFEEIYDIFAVRFIIEGSQDEKADCWRVYSIVSDIYTPNPRRLRDWLSVPKSNGYESLQTTVLGPGKKWVEVQIRTDRMDEIAEKGFAAHWRYKGGTSDSIIENWLNELREILENPTDSAIELLDDIKLDLQDKEVHVFTPKGDLITLPGGATLIDFAYAIHTNVGDHCIGGKVNQRNETLRYKLNNGDQISIITAANQQPRADWLNYAVTSKARNKIRQFISESTNHQADIGKEMLERRVKNWKLDFNDEVIRKLLHFYKYKFANDLYQAIADEKYDWGEIKEILIPSKPDEKPVIAPAKDIEIEHTKNKITEDVLLIDRSIDNVDYKFAKCCNPVFGDDIIGFVSIGDGIKVHRRQCKNAIALQERYPYRIVQTQWTNAGAATYQTDIVIIGRDEIGMATKITELISKESKINMRAISINSSDGIFEGKITVLIDTAEHLDQLMNRLKRIPGIIKVSRNDSIIG